MVQFYSAPLVQHPAAIDRPDLQSLYTKLNANWPAGTMTTCYPSSPIECVCPGYRIGRLQSRSRNLHVGIQEPALGFGESHAKWPFNSAMPPSKDFAIVLGYRTGQVYSGWLVVLNYRRSARPDLLTGPSTRRSSWGWFPAVAAIGQISIGFPTGAKCQADEGLVRAHTNPGHDG